MSKTKFYQEMNYKNQAEQPPINKTWWEFTIAKKKGCSAIKWTACGGLDTLAFLVTTMAVTADASDPFSSVCNRKQDFINT